ncbi:hypothetical protein QEG_2030, partial [Clostridioides difficile CD127]
MYSSIVSSAFNIVNSVLKFETLIGSINTVFPFDDVSNIVPL